MKSAEIAWKIGRYTIQPPTKLLGHLKVYGAERVPMEGGLVIACNHFSWVDPPILGAACPRTIYYMAKMEAHRVPGLGQLIRAFGTFSVRRGESDREAVRMMREIVRGGNALGLFVEGTRQRSGVPGVVQPGAAMVALQEGVPILPVAVHGSLEWTFRHRTDISIAWGTPLELVGLPKGGKGYREASVIVQREIRRLWDWLVEMHAKGRPDGVPPETHGARDEPNA
jgi:1-acyl-sn-glycerol-3-phosphate acyltransferase